MAVNYLAQYSYLKEPQLSFSRTEARYTSENPLKGLLTWGPYDASIPGFFRPNPVRVAVISSERYVANFLENLTRLNAVTRLNKQHGYLCEYPGFSKAFRTNLELPTLNSPLVSKISDAEFESALKNTQPELAFLEVLKRHIQPFISQRHLFHVLIIHVEQRFAQFREKTNGEYVFDLHDALKAHCAPNNIKTQLIEDRAFRYPEPAQVLWWLGLALYVKANGIPWRSAASTPYTAYVGLCYGVKPTASGKKIVLGCSQVFDEHGEGLRFLLFPIDDPIWINNDPFMSRSEARRLMTKVRELYQQTNPHRPRRVVVHKTTYFNRDEMDGISEAMEGVEELELLTIQQNTSFRAIMSDATDPTKPSNFPVHRSVVLPLNGTSFLLWTQGDVEGIDPRGWHYYQESRSIPSPLVVNRYRGRDDLVTVAEEVLKLTKMNWNNLQLYNRLPVTLIFARRIAEIVKQLDNFTTIPQDFRFYI